MHPLLKLVIVTTRCESILLCLYIYLPRLLCRYIDPILRLGQTCVAAPNETVMIIWDVWFFFV
jgi:hypothetical protein